ncbi:MAG: hypothetical protein IPK97_01955 [Ahniella sp.]|nr:hypothetical protein [Ahniella sp.]
MPLFRLLLPVLLIVATQSQASSSCPGPAQARPEQTADATTSWATHADAATAWPDAQPGLDWLGSTELPTSSLAAARPMTIYTIPVGSGNCQMMLCPSENRMMMFDCGSTGAGNLGWNRADVGQFIAANINDQTAIVVSISHPDADHSNYLPDVLAGRPVRAVLVSKHPSDYPAAVVAWMGQLQQDGTTIQWRNGIYRSQAPDQYLSCYAPDGQGGWNIDVPGFIVMMNAGATANDSSMVIAQQYAGFQSLFTGDMTGATEFQIDPNIPVALDNTKVITGAHHGAISHGSNSPQWTAANQGKLVMFSSGTRFHHPRCAAVGNYFPYLFNNAAQHQFQCGDNGQWQTYNTQNAVYVTNNNGLIRVRVNDQGQWDYQAAQNALVHLNAIELQARDRQHLTTRPAELDCLGPVN